MALDGFSEVRRKLFDSLVVDELDYEGQAESPNLPPPALRVVPRAHSLILVKELTPPGQGGYWGAAKDLLVDPDDITLAFLDYFDWGEVESRDFRFYRCEILGFPRFPEFEGREALIEVMNGKVYHDEESDDLDRATQGLK